MILVFLKAADDKEVAFANYHLLHGKFQDLHSGVKNILKECVSKSNPISLVIADSLYGLGKETWDKKESMWKEKEFVEVLEFIKVTRLKQNI